MAILCTLSKQNNRGVTNFPIKISDELLVKENGDNEEEEEEDEPTKPADTTNNGLSNLIFFALIKLRSTAHKMKAEACV